MRAPGSVLLVVLVAALAGLGCAGEHPDCAPTAVVAPRPETAGTAAVGKKTGDLEPKTWETVGTEVVEPDRETTASASRYTLDFPKFSVLVSVEISISEYDAGVADVTFGPDGIMFAKPVTVTIDYAGTALDPDSGNYRGWKPAAFYYDPDRENWVAIPHVVDAVRKTVTFQVEHFSRYGLTDAVRTEDWQWNRTGRPIGKVEGHRDR